MNPLLERYSPSLQSQADHDGAPRVDDASHALYLPSKWAGPSAKHLKLLASELVSLLTVEMRRKGIGFIADPADFIGTVGTAKVIDAALDHYASNVEQDAEEGTGEAAKRDARIAKAVRGWNVKLQAVTGKDAKGWRVTASPTFEEILKSADAKHPPAKTGGTAVEQRLAGLVLAEATSPAIRRCVSAVASKDGGGGEAVRKAFAICTAQAQKRGELEPGSNKPTAAGKARTRSLAAQKGHSDKVTRYSELLAGARKT